MVDQSAAVGEVVHLCFRTKDRASELVGWRIPEILIDDDGVHVVS